MTEQAVRSGWKPIQEAPVTPLSDVQTEQLVESFVDGELNTTSDDSATNVDLDCTADSDSQIANDRKIAEALQYEYNLEHDHFLRAQENIINGHQKVRTSLKNYLILCPDQISTDNDAPDAVEEVADIDPVVPNHDVCRDSLGNYISKHDPVTCGRRNACRAMHLPNKLEVGDLIGQRLSNVAYNSLKSWGKTERQRRNRRQDKSQHAISQIVLDPKTAVILLGLVDKGTLEEIGACMANGKEATVFYAVGGYCEGKAIPRHCAIKVFHTTINEFKSRSKYIKDDYRFESRFRSLNTQKVVRLWAEKEFHNLSLMTKAGINCPTPVLIRNNILVMKLIGSGPTAAPTLHDAILNDDEDLDDAFKQSVQIMASMFTDCNLVHADMSEYNLLWCNGKLWVLDVAQSITVCHPDAFIYLHRDCFNVCKFFRKCGLENVPSAEQLFQQITGFKYDVDDEEYQSKMSSPEQKPEGLSPQHEGTEHHEEGESVHQHDLPNRPEARRVAGTRIAPGRATSPHHRNRHDSSEEPEPVATRAPAGLIVNGQVMDVKDISTPESIRSYHEKPISKLQMEGNFKGNDPSGNKHINRQMYQPRRHNN